MGLFSRQKTNRVKKTPRSKKRSKKTARRFTPPRLTRAQLAAGLRSLRLVGISGLFVAGLLLMFRVLDRPVTSIEVKAPFLRVTPMQVQDGVRQNLGGGVLSADLQKVRGALEALPWVDSVRIGRRWPSRLHIEVIEQVPAARWGERGLVNTRGELFVTDARHIPAELPLLSGPEGSHWDMSQRFTTLRVSMLKAGLQLKSLSLDPRGSWLLELAPGIEVRLGRHAVDQRIERFVDVVTPLIAGRTEVIDYVDLRYPNGFAIGWHEGAARVASEPPQSPAEDDDA